MPAVSFTHSETSPVIERVRCSTCGRTWAVYEGAIPRMWTLCADRLYCDRRTCNAALEKARLALRLGRNQPSAHAALSSFRPGA